MSWLFDLQEGDMQKAGINLMTYRFLMRRSDNNRNFNSHLQKQMKTHH